jgi:GNAT superfamily N-acetyltransferase
MDPSSPLDNNASLNAARLGLSSPLRQLLAWAVGPPADVAGCCTLRDGASVTIRPIRGQDAQRVREFHLHLSPQTLYLRFAHLVREFPDELVAWLVSVDGDQRMAFVATGAENALDDPTREEIIGIARYNHIRPQVAEMAAVVADPWQGRGLGPLLIYRLAIYGRARGYTSFIAPMSRWNGSAIRALIRCELPYTLKRLDEDTLLASIDITPLDRLREQWGSAPGAGS